MIFVSHDLALVAEVAHNITVMYAGQVIEQAPTKELLTNPIHEYTRGLLGSVLSLSLIHIFLLLVLGGISLLGTVFAPGFIWTQSFLSGDGGSMDTAAFMFRFFAIRCV